MTLGSRRAAPLIVALLIGPIPAAGDMSLDPPPRQGAGGREEKLCELRTADRARATTRSCLACHDGTVAPATAHDPAGAHRGSGLHPVEIDYDRAAMRAGTSLLPRGALAPALVLPGGKLTCTTCHDGASRLPARTALPMSGSRLCLACHAM